MCRYSVVLVASLMFFSGCGGGGTDTQTPVVSTTSTQSSSVIERQLRDDFGFAGASNIRELDTNIVAFTYFKDGNKHFAIFDLAQKKKLSEKADFQGDIVTNSTKDSVTFANNTKVTVDTSDYTKPPVIASQPTYKEQKSAQEYIRDYYENDGSDWTIMQSFTYSSDNYSDAAVVVANSHAWDFYIYDIPSDGNPYIVHTIKPPSTQDEWTNIYNVRRIGGGKITFTGVSKGVGEKNYTYYYLDHYYANSSNNMGDNNNQNNTGAETGHVSAGDNKTIPLASDLYLGATSISGLSAPLTYLWTDSNGNTLSRSSGFAYAGNVVGTHTLYLTVTDRNGNYAKDYVLITVTNNGSSSGGSLTQQFKDNIDNFEWSYISHAVSPQGHGAVVLAQSDAGSSKIYLYDISDNGTVTREETLQDLYGTISNLRIYSGGQYSYTYQGESYYDSYL